MKIEALLDTPSILANQAAPVHVMIRFTAGARPAGGRDRPIAFAAVIDRSGSMAGRPLAAACEAARLAVRNLRPDDLFTLVTFDHIAQVVIPLQTVRDKQAALARIDAITEGGSTNLTAGWSLGRDELHKAPAGVPRRLLLLSDGELNAGITAPDMVKQIVARGLERGGIRTSCLGFGPAYNEQLLGLLSGATAGTFYDANSPEKLPGIFAAELEGLQGLAAQNVRLRIRRLDFCDTLILLADYPVVSLPDGRVEIAVGDLVSEETRTLVAQLLVLPIPLLDNGRPAASLEGEALLELEAAYDAITADGIASATWRQVLRVVPVQDPAAVRYNDDVIPWVAQQRAGRVAEEAIRATEAGDVRAAIARLQHELQDLQRFGTSPAAEEARRFLRDLLARLEDTGGLSTAERKTKFYSSRSRRRMSSAQYWTVHEPEPEFIQRKPSPSVPPPATGPSTSTTPPEQQQAGQ